MKRFKRRIDSEIQHVGRDSFDVSIVWVQGRDTGGNGECSALEFVEILQLAAIAIKYFCAAFLVEFWSSRQLEIAF